jgi:hypothetical protein
MPDSKNITANGQSVVWDVGDGVTNAVFHCSGTFAGANCTFEGTIDGTNWFPTDAVRSSGNVTETATGVLGAAPAYSWDVSCGGYAKIRVRATAFTSGTQVWTAGMYRGGIEAAVNAVLTAAIPAGTANIGLTGTVVPSQTFLNSAATTNATSVKAGSGTVFGLAVTNTNAAARYLKLYNKASAPTVGTDIPVLTVVLAPTSSQSISLGTLGFRFGTGIAFALTTGITDADAVAVGAGDVKVAMAWV